MLNKILELLNVGRAYSQFEIAAELGISIDLVNAQLDYLNRVGMINKVSNNCSASCANCSSKCNNDGLSPPVIWEKSI